MEYIDSKHIKLFICFFVTIICAHRVFFIWNYYFGVPASDFFSFRNHAIWFEHWEIRWGDKRLPLFPLLMAILAQPFKLFGIDHPYLISAYLINLISLSLSIPLLYSVNKKILKSTVLSLLSTFLFVINAEYLVWNIQPILDTFLVFSILLTFYLYFFKRMELKYFGVCFASLIRYEAILLAPIFLFDDIFFKKRERKKLILLGPMAIAPLTFWVISAYLVYGLPAYLRQVQVIGSHAGLSFLLSINWVITIGIYFGFNGLRFLITRLIVSIILIIGLISFHKNRFFLPLFLWLGSYTALHMYFSFNYSRFVIPILWLIITFCVYGLNSSYNTIRKQMHHNFSKFHKISLMILVITTFSFYQFYDKSYILNAFFVDILVASLLLSTFSLIIILETADQKRNNYKISLILIILFLSTFASTFNGDIRTNDIAYQKIQFRKVGEWYKDVALKNDILVATSIGIVQHYSGLPNEFFLGTASFRANTTTEFIEELKNRGVTYVVWDSYQGNRAKDYYYNVYRVWLISFLSDGENKPHFELVYEVDIHSQIAYVYKFSP